MEKLFFVVLIAIIQYVAFKIFGFKLGGIGLLFVLYQFRNVLGISQDA